MSNNSIFISYSRADHDFVKPLVLKMKKAGIKVWWDKSSIEAGERWDNSISGGLAESQTILLVLSKTSVASENVMDEISYAMDEKKKIVPVLIEECEIPFRIRRLQFIDLSNKKRRDFGPLIEALGLNKKTASRFSKQYRKKSKVPRMAFLLVMLLVLLYVYNQGYLDNSVQTISNTINPVDYSSPWEEAKSENSIASYSAFISTYNSEDNPYIQEANTRVDALLPYKGFVEFKMENGELLFDLVSTDSTATIKEKGFIISKDLRMIKLQPHSQNYAEDILNSGDILKVLKIIPNSLASDQSVWIEVAYGPYAKM